MYTYSYIFVEIREMIRGRGTKVYNNNIDTLPVLTIERFENLKIFLTKFSEAKWMRGCGKLLLQMLEYKMESGDRFEGRFEQMKCCVLRFSEIRYCQVTFLRRT